MMPSLLQRRVVVVLCLVLASAFGWAPSHSSSSRPSSSTTALMPSSSSSLLKLNTAASTRRPTASAVLLFSSKEDASEEEKQAAAAAAAETTSFDKAGQALTEEEDKKRMDEMGDFDLNPNFQTDNMEAMRTKIRERTAAMGLEKSKVSADYILSKQKQAIGAGPPGQNVDPDTFGGLDLSQISDTAPPGSVSSYDESLPSMFYDPKDDLSEEEQAEVDPISAENPITQGLNELSNAKWPGMAAALREVVVLVIVVAATAALIISWDKLLRGTYMNAGFIPSKEALSNYASRFDGLDLPSGWTNNMSEDDVAQIAEQVNTVVPSGGSLPSL